MHGFATSLFGKFLQEGSVRRHCRGNLRLCCLEQRPDFLNASPGRDTLTGGLERCLQDKTTYRTVFTPSSLYQYGMLLWAHAHTQRLALKVLRFVEVGT